MKKFLSCLNQFLAPTLISLYFALSVILLAVVEGKLPFLLAILWGALSAAALRWGIWGILCLARRRATKEELKILVITVEVLLLLLFAGAVAVVCLLWALPSVWLFLLTPLFGLKGAVKFHIENF